MVFDKTGTLTEEGLSVSGFKSIKEHGGNFNFDEYHHECSQLGEAKKLMNQNDWATRYVECLASCHSVSLLDDIMIGDPLDIKMFEATGWTLDESQANDKTNIEEARVYPEDTKD